MIAQKKKNIFPSHIFSFVVIDIIYLVVVQILFQFTKCLDNLKRFMLERVQVVNKH